LKGPVRIVQKHKTLQNIKEGKNTNQKTKEIKNTNEVFQFKRRLIDTTQFHCELHLEKELKNEMENNGKRKK
jgi:hypothetical protein